MGDCCSSPDITIVSNGLINDVTWQPIISMGSAHLPIIITIDRPSDFITSERRTFVNQKKLIGIGSEHSAMIVLLIYHFLQMYGERTFRKINGINGWIT